MLRGARLGTTAVSGAEGTSGLGTGAWTTVCDECTAVSVGAGSPAVRFGPRVHLYHGRLLIKFFVVCACRHRDERPVERDGFSKSQLGEQRG